MKKKEKIKVLQINLLNSLIENTHLKTQLKEQEDKYKNDLFSYSEGVVKRVSEKMYKNQKIQEDLEQIKNREQLVLYAKGFIDGMK
jgi:C4-type Zn-finger protein